MQLLQIGAASESGIAMDLFRRLIGVMVLLFALPLAVAGVAAFGLWRMDRGLDAVAEEYGEARLLEPVNRGLSAAAVALASDDPMEHASGRRYLAEAEEAMIRYLAAQYETVSSEEHQAAESSRAAELLRQIHQLSAASGMVPRSTRAADLMRLRGELEALMESVDGGVAAAHESARTTRQVTVTAVFVTSFLAVAACAVLLVWSTRSIGRRLRELHRVLSAQSPAAEAPPARDVGAMVSQIEVLNAQLLQRVEESGRELLRRERLAGVGLLAADVAHEINNPMNAMLGLSELGLRTLEGGPVDEAGRKELEESLRVIRREALRCRGIVERLVAMVRRDRSPGWFDAARLVRETVQVARAARPDKAACYVVPECSTGVRAYGPTEDVRQIMLTLLINAADAIDPDGRIEADATRTDGEVWLRVRDDGRGFNEGARKAFFTPFHSSREGGGGTGLGLSIAQALAEGMGATLRPFSAGLGRGSMFVLAIPVREGEP